MSNMNFVRLAWRCLSHSNALPKLARPPVSVYQNFAFLFFLRTALMMRAVPG
jgi:hypothetical protein